jgi:predicted peptidase
MQKLFAICSLVLLMSIGFAQDSTLYEKKYLARGKDTLRYRIMYPAGYNPAKQYPLVLFLHGAGQRGADNEMQLRNGGTTFGSKMAREKYPAIVIFPQCPRNDFWSRIAFNIKNPKDSLGPLLFPSNQPIGPNLNLVSLLLDSLVATKIADNKRIYIGGLSMGGMGTFELLWRKPGFFAAAFPMCGGGDPEKVTVYASHFPIWVFHGDKDRTVAVSNSRRMVNALRAAGANVKYTEYPGVAHNCWDRALAEPNLLPWLFKQAGGKSEVLSR